MEILTMVLKIHKYDSRVDQHSSPVLLEKVYSMLTNHNMRFNNYITSILTTYLLSFVGDLVLFVYLEPLISSTKYKSSLEMVVYLLHEIRDHISHYSLEYRTQMVILPPDGYSFWIWKLLEFVENHAAHLKLVMTASYNIHIGNTTMMILSQLWKLDVNS